MTFPEEISDQLKQFEFVYTKAGVKYALPEGEHDDDAIALALCWHKWKTASLNEGGTTVH